MDATFGRKIAAAVDPKRYEAVAGIQVTEGDALLIQQQIMARDDSDRGLTFDLAGYVAKHLRYTYGVAGVPGLRPDQGFSMRVLLTVG